MRSSFLSFGVIPVCSFFDFPQLDVSNPSDLQSGFVLRALNRLFSGIGYGAFFTQYVVRKLARFAEYLFFGLLLTFTIYVIRKNFLRGILCFELFLFLGIPVLDETIQLFYRGRTSSVLDVLIDFAGCMVGMGLYRLILLKFIPMGDV